MQTTLPLVFMKHDNSKICLTFSSAEDKQKNPMVQLFYGTFVTERKHEGTSFIWTFGTVNFIVCSVPQPLTSPSLCSGKVLCNIEQFGQYPLQVNGFNNLDECLEGAMVEKEIESLHSEHSVTSGREVSKSEGIGFVHVDQLRCLTHEVLFFCLFVFLQRWFKKLPPVLTFELSRFEFNTQLGRPEKIHKKLEFPPVIYMDRWGLDHFYSCKNVLRTN